MNTVHSIIHKIEYVQGINKLDGHPIKTNTKIHLQHYNHPFMYLGKLNGFKVGEKVNMRYETIKLNNTHYWIDTIEKMNSL